MKRVQLPHIIDKRHRYGNFSSFGLPTHFKNVFEGHRAFAQSGRPPDVDDLGTLAVRRIWIRGVLPSLSAINNWLHNRRQIRVRVDP